MYQNTYLCGLVLNPKRLQKIGLSGNLDRDMYLRTWVGSSSVLVWIGLDIGQSMDKAKAWRSSPEFCGFRERCRG